MSRVQALIAAQKQKHENVKPTIVEIRFGDELVDIRFWPLTGQQWRDLTARHPYRPDSEFDNALGYNLAGVLVGYPTATEQSRVYLVDGDNAEQLSPDDWADMCAVLDGPELQKLEHTIWAMHEYDRAQETVAAGKARAGERQKKQH
ncbi:hypothetical protein [Microbacterium sp. YY-01]|uniref:hypothetical protein n=1 Tax=Microbacterium sp. YY-01 TaxID=3421634 RepID=UPI003D1716C2